MFSCIVYTVWSIKTIKMLPILLVLLVATSALAAPSVSLRQNSINEIAPQQSNGRLVGDYLMTNAFELIDGGDTNIYILTLQQILADLANQPDPDSQAHALAVALAVLSQLATGVAGDSCAAADAINAFVSNPGSPAASGFIQSLVASIDNIVLLSSNPGSLRYAAGPRGNCNGGGRNYNFEAAWDFILANVQPGSAGLLTEEYCAAKRMYNAFNARSNNVAAYVTAAALPSVTGIVRQALEPVARFLAAVSAGNAAGAAGAAKQALLRAASGY